jgi:uncharacterized membrane protein (UPF0127 family)
MLLYRVMSRNKKMMLLSISAALVLFVIAFGAWWYLFFGKPNPPLPRADISIASSSSSSTTGSAVGVASSSVLTSSVVAPTAPAVTTPLVDGENPPLAEEQLGIDGAAFNVEIASTMLEQARGLSFRPSLGENDGMLFLLGMGSMQTFWMQSMNFSLDMIWVSGTTVVGFAQDVPAPAPGTQPWQLPLYSSPGNTDKVLEVNAGTVARYSIKVGDTLTIGPIK